MGLLSYSGMERHIDKFIFTDARKEGRRKEGGKEGRKPSKRLQLFTVNTTLNPITLESPSTTL